MLDQPAVTTSAEASQFAAKFHKQNRIRLLLDTCESTRSFEASYFSYRVLYDLFTSSSPLVESILIDIQFLYRKYIIFSEFSDACKDVILYKFIGLDSFGEYSEFLSNIQNILINYHICSHLKDMYEQS